MIMTFKSILFIAAFAASANTFAAGRDSVYAKPGQMLMPSKAAAVAIEGRSSVYAKDLAAPRKSTGYAHSTVGQFGRA
jgi:hypothetical protein